MQKCWWNYRVTRERGNHAGGEQYDLYSIREVYYTAAGATWSWTENAMDPYGETLQELADNLAAMAGALARPVFDLDERADVPLVLADKE